MINSDENLRKILIRTKVVAIVGISADPMRPSYFVARYLKLKGLRVIGVNPTLSGQSLFGETIYADLASIPDDVHMVDIFRRSDSVGLIVDDALKRWPRLQTIWMQIGVMNSDAADRAQGRDVDVVQNRCPKIEYQRLFGELRMAGFNTGIISSKL